MANSCPVVIIAAGESKRLGRPKVFVEVAGKSLLIHAIERFQKLNCEPVVIVTNQECFFQTTIDSKGTAVVLNSNPKDGRTGSIQLGISSIMNEIGRVPKRVIIAPVDRPGWDIENILSLMESNQSSCLASNGVSGHTVLLVGDDLHTVISAEKHIPLRDIISFEKKHVEAPFLSMNIDTEKDVEYLRENKHFFEIN